MRILPGIILLFLALVVAPQSAHAVLKCRLAYLPPGTQGTFFSNPKTLLPPGTSGTSIASFAADGVIRTAAVQFQLDSAPAARASGTGTLRMRINVASNLSNPALDAIYDAEFVGYSFPRGDRASRRVVNPNGQGEDFFRQPNDPPNAMKFVGPGDFPAAAAAKLKDQVIANIELSCQNERP